MSLLRAINPVANAAAFPRLTLLLLRHRELAIELARRDLTDRYEGQILGALWVFGHPLLMFGLYVFVFGYIFVVRTGGSVEMPRNYVIYLMAGLVPWLACADVLNRSVGTILSNAPLVRQISFPVEILPVKVVLSAAITELVTLTILIVYALWMDNVPLFAIWTVPLLLALQLMLMIGIAYVLSALGAYLKDLKDVITFVASANFFLMPMIYLPSSTPVIFGHLFYLNPFSYQIWCWQDALYFGRFEHPWAWPVLIALSCFAYVLGYRTFGKLRPGFGDIL